MAATICCSEQEAWDYLNSNQNCAEPCPDYLYRGQSNRYLRRWPPKAEPGIPKHHYELDGIIPTDYRGLEDAIEAGTASSIPLFYSDEAARLRSVLTWGAVVEHGDILPTQDHEAVKQWLKAQDHLCHRFDAVGSIGQHYGLMTGYTDASASLAVAFWMATRDFNTGAYLPSGHSVIYRWKLKTLGPTLACVNATHGLNGNTWPKVRDMGVLRWAEKAMAKGRFGRLGFSFHDDNNVFI
jgi:hypothetical protein